MTSTGAELRAWHKVPLRRLGSTVGGSGFPPSAQGVRGEELSFYKVKYLASIDPLGFLPDADDTVSRETAQELGASVVPAGSLTLAKVGAALLLGRVGRLTRPSCIDNNMTAFVPNDLEDSRFLQYALTQIPMAAIVNPGAVPSLSDRHLVSFEIPLPSRRYRQKIAAYLDRETAQIDTLISEQQHLLEVLAERRQAAIAEAVMPSGNPLNDAVGWPRIGHGWNVSLGKMLDAGKAVPVESTSLPYVRAGNIQDHGLDLASVNEMPFTPEEATQFDLRAGDLLVVEGGAVGTNVTLTMDMPGWAFQKTVNRARPVNGGDSRWLGYVLRTYRDSGVLDIVCNKSTIAHLTAEKLRGLPVPPCSNSDQRRIADRVDAEVARLDELSSEATRFIKLARERRAALITAAVTGQIEIPED